jgi:hypothetical protein
VGDLHPAAAAAAAAAASVLQMDALSNGSTSNKSMRSDLAPLPAPAGLSSNAVAPLHIPVVCSLDMVHAYDDV